MTSRKAPIVMAHGAFCGAWTFEHFRAPFEAAGHAVHAVDLRGHAPADAPSAVTGLSMADYATDLARICSSLSEPPVLLGHSLGGLAAQLAARKAKLSALVLLAPSPPWGITGASLEEAASAVSLHLLGPFWLQAIAPDRTVARTYSLDRLARPERDAVLGRMRPESGRALWEALNWWMDPFMTTSLGPGPLTCPSLVVAGARDVVHPPATARQIAERLGGSCIEMPAMSHWLPGEPGWEDVAAHVLAWLAKVTQPA